MSSPQINGNTDKLCNSFMDGAKKKGHSVYKVDIEKYNLKHCDSCYKCKQQPFECHIKDDMGFILDKFMKADAIVLASPVYFYSISAQLKTFIDRCLVIWEKVENKEFYFIVSCAQNSKLATATTIGCMRGFITCLKNSKECSMICAYGINKTNPLESTDYINQAYKLGYSI